jgi:23S rRNA pseudouridine1911/1915/1917 synthase
MAVIGHPLVGDKLYGPDEELFERGIDGTLSADDLRALRLPRQALHSHRLAFTTPDGGRLVDVECPLAEDMRAFLDVAPHARS